MKFANFVKKEKEWNITIVTVLALCISLYIAGVAQKVDDAHDGTIDMIKLILVWTNVVMLGLLLFQKKVFQFGASWLKSVFLFGMLLVNIAAFINFSILIKNFNNPGKDNNFLPFNYDFLTLGITLTTDILYIVFYALFKTKRALIISIVLVVTEIIIFGACSSLGDDIAVDIANFTVSMITTFMAIVLWSAKVVMNENGQPLEFKDYFERDDLEDMEVMVNADKQKHIHVSPV